MILQRLAGTAVVALVGLTYTGCSSSSSPAPVTASSTQGPLRPSADIAATQVDASRPTVDPRILPPARAPLAGAPDLDNASFLVSDKTLRAMIADGVPAGMTQSLAPLKGRSFMNVTEFRAAVEDRVGKTPAAETQVSKILHHALIVTLADPPEPPAGNAELQPAETQKRSGKQPAVAAVKGAKEAKEVVLGNMGDSRFKPVFFDYAKAGVKNDFGDAVTANAAVLKADPKLKIVIEGHCDQRGSAAYNLALGQRRADAVAKAFIAAGVPKDQIRVVTYGSSRPVDPGTTDEAYSKNRRVVINLQ